MVRVKVCGLTRLRDAVACVEAGADVLGFVRESSSKRCFHGDGGTVSEGILRLKSLLPWTPMVGVYGEWRGDDEAGVFDVLQGFGVPEEAGERRIKVLRVGAGASVDGLLQEGFGHPVVLLDAHVEGMQGGTGKTVDWGLAAEFVQEFDGRVVLAGGLGPENVGEAVRRVRPFGVDASSRLEVSPGVKDLEAVRAFVEGAKGGGGR